VLLVADADASPTPGVIESELLGVDSKGITPGKVLVLLHPEYTVIPSGTSKWLDARDLETHCHVRWNKKEDFKRLARILSKRAVGLALGGGAAKGIAHVGVIRALEEAGIPIDMIGGASMGSIIGAKYAMGRDYQTLLSLCKKIFIEINPFNEYTLPIISLLKSKKLRDMGKVAYGDTQIEDLWINFFCVSTNLTTSELVINRRGPVWRAVRTSSAVPGMIKPVLHNRELFVDGGVINNLPGDIIRQECGVLIVVDVNPKLDLSVKLLEIPSPWKVLWSKIVPFTKSIQVPNILDILLSAVLTGSYMTATSVKQVADMSLTPPVNEVGFLDFKNMEKTAEIGYRYTMEVLENLDDKGLIEALRGKY
jgi:predicted acylesterase/phospholipase RssA